MDSFFDTNIIIKYGSYSPLIENKLDKKCYEYIIHKKEKFIVCLYVLDEIKSVLKKRAIIHRETLSKMRNREYNIGESEVSKSLSKEDIAYSKKLYESFKEADAEQASKIFAEERNNLDIKIALFLKTKMDERVIPVEDIDKNIVSIINEFIKKYSDCLVLASAIQEQQKREIFIFVTADNHFDPNGYDFIKTEPRMKKYKFPELKNLLFES